MSILLLYSVSTKFLACKTILYRLVNTVALKTNINVCFVNVDIIIIFTFTMHTYVKPYSTYYYVHYIDTLWMIVAQWKFKYFVYKSQMSYKYIIQYSKL